ncbi:MAG: 2Fe-2S iron-sulfur cluster-binding protein, partial [Bacillota bacterium]|nr:2Fe-2S iron-sulfur cluster-binding protein [Bacillota bacterium]
MIVNVDVNGRLRSFDVLPGAFLLDVLREAGYTSVRRGCDSTSCGICTVLVDGKPVPSCSYLAIRAEGKKVTTVEGIPEEAARLARHFGEEGADQCGYCNPSLALAV